MLTKTSGIYLVFAGPYEQMKKKHILHVCSDISDNIYENSLSEQIPVKLPSLQRFLTQMKYQYFQTYRSCVPSWWYQVRMWSRASYATSQMFSTISTPTRLHRQISLECGKRVI